MEQDLIESLLVDPRLASPELVVAEVVRLCQASDTSLMALANLVAQDAALTVAVLRAAQRQQKHGELTVVQAMNLLGAPKTRTAVLGACLAMDFRRSTGERPPAARIWGRALLAAAAVRSIGAVLRLRQTEAIAAATLTQDVGLLAMLAAKVPGYADLLAEAGANHASLCPLERARYGADHGRIGSELLNRWQLPMVFGLVAAFHESPQQAPSRERGPACVAALGNLAAQCVLGDDTRADAIRFGHEAHAWFNLDAEQSRELLETIRRGSADVLRQAGLAPAPAPAPETGAAPAFDAASLMYEAKAALAHITDAMQENLARVRAEKQQVQDAFTRDPLTCILTRGAFNQAIAKAFRDAAQHGTHLSLIMLDCDHFKKVNDTYGHISGDEVLKSLSRILVTHSPPGSLAARLGGEEMCVLLPGTEMETAAAVAEDLRQTIERTTVESADGRPIQISASFGVASTGPDRPHAVPLDLVHAADTALYTAKHDGRNRICRAAPLENTVALMRRRA